MVENVKIPELSGKAILVTGASTGIGAALAIAYGGQEASVGIHYNSNRDAAEDVAAKVREAGGEPFVVQGDFSVSDDVRHVVEETATHFGGLNGLVNNAGSMVERVSYANADDAYYDAVMDLNARSVVTASRTALPFLKIHGGFIINTTSVAARNGATIGAGLYGSSKAFVANVTRGMAKEFIADNVRVNAVAPGVILTPFQDQFATPELLEAAKPMIPAGRLGSADDCVGAYLFLSTASLSGYVIGQVLEVNGGMLMP